MARSPTESPDTITIINWVNCRYLRVFPFRPPAQCAALLGAFNCSAPCWLELRPGFDFTSVLNAIPSAAVRGAEASVAGAIRFSFQKAEITLSSHSGDKKTACCAVKVTEARERPSPPRSGKGGEAREEGSGSSRDNFWSGSLLEGSIRVEGKDRQRRRIKAA